MIDFCSIPLTFRHHRVTDGSSQEMLSKLLESDGPSWAPVRRAVCVAVGACLTVAAGYGVYRLLQYRAANRPPREWQRVGEVSDLWIYPIKSCGAVRVRQFDCTDIGPAVGLLRDRTFMVVRSGDGTFITGRSHPTMVLVQPAFDADYEQMTLSAPGMLDIVVEVRRLLEGGQAIGTASVWDQPVSTIDCGEEVARWLSRFLLSEDFGLRLVLYPHDSPTRPVRPNNRIHALLTARDSGALHDATSYMLVSEASVADVNSRLERSVPALQFRANILVKGPAAFAEDNWKWVRIGSTIYRNVKPCTRCLFTNVSPETGKRSPDQEPLTTLRAYRTKPGLGATPVLGTQMGVRTLGTIALGEAVHVGL
ncbi:mitochondrial amidoxime-reducing component 1 isoform X1 [Anopheles bellator]|uniref:mitochondrial amidoxime-reducing component 1 isoform X1 n=2 Tax=Anopheles bellator TaxID=139047 RepID=UPI002647FE03|nr:mitochondrial amidoxime-reducing component 1 isoform X1 [Anopheles bellator]